MRRAIGVINSDWEAEIFCTYLVRSSVSADVKKRYSKIVANWDKAAAGVRVNESKQLAFVSKHPWSIGMLDGASALVTPNSELRSRLFLFFAILEATPEYSDYFLAKDRNVLYIVTIAFTGLRAVARTACGLVLLKTAGLSG